VEFQSVSSDVCAAANCWACWHSQHSDHEMLLNFVSNDDERICSLICICMAFLTNQRGKEALKGPY
jgi:hypothetical protein